MFCPFCSAEDTRVIDSRLVVEGNQVRRRRECSVCHQRFNSYEVAEFVMPKVIKRSGDLVSFNEDKIRQSLCRAFSKREIDGELIESCLSDITKIIQQKAHREITSEAIGEVVMEVLKSRDPVAFVRFVSVYHRFSDIKAFKKLIEALD